MEFARIVAKFRGEKRIRERERERERDKREKKANKEKGLVGTENKKKKGGGRGGECRQRPGAMQLIVVGNVFARVPLGGIIFPFLLRLPKCGH